MEYELCYLIGESKEGDLEKIPEPIADSGDLADININEESLSAQENDLTDEIDKILDSDNLDEIPDVIEDDIIAEDKVADDIIIDSSNQAIEKLNKPEGNEISEADTQDKEDKPSNNKKSNKKKSKLMPVLLLLIVLGGAGYYFLFMSPEQQKPRVKKLVKVQKPINKAPAPAVKPVKKVEHPFVFPENKNFQKDTNEGITTLVYNTGSQLDAVQKYYREKMASMEYKIEKEDYKTGSRYAYLVFSKEDKNCSVILRSREDNVCAVVSFVE